MSFALFFFIFLFAQNFPQKTHSSRTYWNTQVKHLSLIQFRLDVGESHLASIFLVFSKCYIFNGSDDSPFFFSLHFFFFFVSCCITNDICLHCSGVLRPNSGIEWHIRAQPLILSVAAVDNKFHNMRNDARHFICWILILDGVRSFFFLFFLLPHLLVIIEI